MKKYIYPFAFVLLIFFRVLVRDSLYEVTFVALLNLTALVLVLLSCYEKIRQSVNHSIERKCKAATIAKREKKRFAIKFSICSIVIAGLFIFLYLLFGCSALGNDLVAIIALAITFAEDAILDLVEYIQEK